MAAFITCVEKTFHLALFLKSLSSENKNEVYIRHVSAHFFILSRPMNLKSVFLFFPEQAKLIIVSQHMYNNDLSAVVGFPPDFIVCS